MNDDPGSSPLRAVWLGRERFAVTLERQIATREEVIAGRIPATVLLVEHPPVLTLGRRGTRADVLWSDDELVTAGVEVCETPRGGQATLHAPGQLVAYPVVHVGRRIRAHVERLGRVSAQLLAELGVADPRFRMDQPGVWAGGRKVASIGVHISRGVTVQGVSLNLDVDPALFDSLVSCGLDTGVMANAAMVGAERMEVEPAARRWAELYAVDLGVALAWDAPDSLPAAVLS